MAYRMTYSVSIDWIGPGMGQTAGVSIYGGPSGANAQTLTLFNQSGGQTIAGSGSSPFTGSIAAADITTLMTNLSTDMQNQFKAAGPLAQMGGWAGGQP